MSRPSQKYIVCQMWTPGSRVIAEKRKPIFTKNGRNCKKHVFPGGHFCVAPERHTIGTLFNNFVSSISHRRNFSDRTRHCRWIGSDSEIRPIRNPVTGAELGDDYIMYGVFGHGEHDGCGQISRKAILRCRIGGPNFDDFRTADSTHRTSVTPIFSTDSNSPAFSASGSAFCTAPSFVLMEL